MSQELQYLSLCEQVIKNGDRRKNRTGVTTISLFAPIPLKFNIEKSIPLFTTKKMAWKTVIKELLWFLRGDTDAKILQRENVHIWDGNTSKEFLKSKGLSYEEGILGPGYGWQWRRFGAKYNEKYADTSKFKAKELPKGVDQIAMVEKLIKEDPFSRRIILSAWNPTVLEEMALPPCHCFIQFYVSSDRKKLSAQVYCRSQDLFLGTCFNVFSYSVLLYILAKRASLVPHELILTMGDAHIYEDHIPLMKKQINREPFEFPELIISDSILKKNFSDFTIDDFTIKNYTSHERIIGAMVA